MTHEALVGRGAMWLRSTKRCEPVLHGLSACPEIPDVIGWQLCARGSIVLECKASRSDFLRDKRKKHDKRMGDYRFIVCEAGLLTPADIAAHAPGHGLLTFRTTHMRPVVELEAPRRPDAHHAAEVEHLRKALIHMSYNVAAHGFELHLPTVTMWDRRDGMKKATPPAEL